jgi:mannan endo-1,4-beta-mannosidase
MKILPQLVLLLLAVGLAHGARLTVSGTKFMFNGKAVFMSGVNFAWYNYGNDFGNNQYANSKTTFATWLNDLQLNGGNTVRK